MLKILIITTVRVGYDGLTAHILSYIGHMNKSDVQVDLVSARGVDPKIQEQIDRCGFHRVHRLECRDTNQALYFAKLLRLMRAESYDIVHVHGNSATLTVDLLAASLAGIPVRIAHSHNTSTEHPRVDSLLRPLFHRCYTDGFACGEEAGKWLFEDGDFTIIPNGREIERYLFDASVRDRIRREILRDDCDKVAIGHVAAFVSKKNHRFFIETFKELLGQDDRFELLLFGIDGDSLDDTLALIDALGLGDRVHYMGVKDNLQDYLQAMDLMVLPSLYEGFPVTVIEWQINGLPCLVSDTITERCNITGDVRFLPIDQGAEPWIETILETDVDPTHRLRPDTVELFTAAGYNIDAGAAELKSRYFSLFQLRGKKIRSVGE